MKISILQEQKRDRTSILFTGRDLLMVDMLHLRDCQSNSPTGAEWSFYVSPDKKYIFYMATKELPKEKQPKSLNLDFFLNLSSMPQNGNSDIYWIDAKIIEELRPKKK